MQKKSNPIRVVFFGTPEFAIPSLRALAEDERFSIAEVVTRPDEPSGRGMQETAPAIKDEAGRLGITVYQPVTLSATETLDHLRTLDADIFVVVAFGRILPSSLLSLPAHGVINAHPSLLPLYRGPTPVQTALLNGDTTSGVSIILLTDGPVDAGPLLAQESCRVQMEDTSVTLSAKLFEMAAQLLPKTIIDYISGTIRPKPQDETRATFSTLMTRAHGEIDCARSAEDAERRVRAFAPWPGAYITFRGKRLKILAAHADSGSFTEKPGSIVLNNKTPVLVCGTGALILDSVQLEGKTPINGAAFASGYLKS